MFLHCNSAHLILSADPVLTQKPHRPGGAYLETHEEDRFRPSPSLLWQGSQLIATDEDLVSLLLEQEHIATVPGTIFGAPGHIRLTYACSEEIILEGIQRIARLLGRLTPD